MNYEAAAFTKQLNSVRMDFNPYVRERSRAPHGLIDAINALVLAYQDDEVSRTFCRDLQNTGSGIWNFAATRNCIDARESNFIIGVFDNPYNQKMGLDCIICNQLAPDAGFREKHPGKFSRVIEIVASTEGFNFNSSVALFAEHYVTDEPVRPENKASYFVDRFVVRYNNITRNILGRCISANSLPLARNAGNDVILQACCVWLHLHEYCHRLGNMPLPEFLDFKTPRNAASIEELRVDVLTVIFCFELAEQGHPLAAQFGEIIFTERCFRYAIQYDINENYDARGSAVLFNYLVKEQVIRRNSAGLLEVDHSRLLPSLRKIIREIDTLELTLRSQSRSRNVDAKKQLVRSYLAWNDTERRYTNHDLMQNIARSLDGVDMSFAYAT